MHLYKLHFVLKLLPLSAHDKETSKLSQFCFYEVTLLGYIDKYLISENKLIILRISYSSFLSHPIQFIFHTYLNLLTPNDL
jgi:hypothetical protein